VTEQDDSSVTHRYFSERFQLLLTGHYTQNPVGARVDECNGDVTSTYCEEVAPSFDLKQGAHLFFDIKLERNRRGSVIEHHARYDENILSFLLK
jgi:hypothetical protein